MATTLIKVLVLLNALIALNDACLNGYTEHGDSCYHVSLDTEAWATAMETCKLDGGYLVEIGSSEENNFVGSLMRKKSVHECWIGGADLDVKGHWKWWTSKTPFSVTFWEPNEPNGAATGEDCAEIKQYGRIGWNDDTCSSLQHYVCEMPFETNGIIG